MPELNRWLQIVEMEGSASLSSHSSELQIYRVFLLQFKVRLTATMAIDFAGCWVIEVLCKYCFADLEPKAMITRGRERREKRRQVEERLKAESVLSSVGTELAQKTK